MRRAVQTAVVGGWAAEQREARRVLDLPFAERRAYVLDVERFAALAPKDREALLDSLVAEARRAGFTAKNTKDTKKR